MKLERYVIHVTRKCNCACKYCYEKDKTSTYSWDEVKSVIDSIVKYNKTFGIEFLGGEPMLAFDLIKKSYEYLESMSDVSVSDYVITTNGTVLTDEAIEFLRANRKIVWAASLDGTKWMNQLRVFKQPDERGANINTYDTVVGNIRKLLDTIGANRMSVHMVTHPYNIYALAKGVDHLYNLGIRVIGIGTVESTMPIGKEYCLEYIRQLDMVSERIKNGRYPNLEVDVLDSLKPRADVRYYMYDENGKLVAESYGRAGRDITSSNDLRAVATTSPVQCMIEDIREIVYTKHQERMRGI